MFSPQIEVQAKCTSKEFELLPTERIHHISDVEKVADFNTLEISVSVNDSAKEQMQPGDFEVASIELFMVRDDQKCGSHVSDIPAVLGRLAVGQTVWFAEEETPARTTFRLDRGRDGRDIPQWLPVEIRFHILMSSLATFEYMANGLSWH